MGGLILVCESLTNLLVYYWFGEGQKGSDTGGATQISQVMTMCCVGSRITCWELAICCVLGGGGMLTMCWAVILAEVLPTCWRITWAGVFTMCWVGSLGSLPCIGRALTCVGTTWAGLLTMCGVGSLGRGRLPCAGWDHLLGVLGGDGMLTLCWAGLPTRWGITWAGVFTMCWWDHAHHVLGGITWAGVFTMCWVGTYHVLGGRLTCVGTTWVGVLTRCWVGSLGQSVYRVLGHLGGGDNHALGGGGGVFTMCNHVWGGILGRGCLPCVGWGRLPRVGRDAHHVLGHLGGGANHVLITCWGGVLAGTTAGGSFVVGGSLGRVYHVLGGIICWVGGYLPCVGWNHVFVGIVLGKIIWAGALAMCWWDHLGRGAWHVLGGIIFLESPSCEVCKKWPSCEVCKTWALHCRFPTRQPTHGLSGARLLKKQTLPAPF